MRLEKDSALKNVIDEKCELEKVITCQKTG